MESGNGLDFTDGRWIYSAKFWDPLLLRGLRWPKDLNSIRRTDKYLVGKAITSWVNDLRSTDISLQITMASYMVFIPAERSLLSPYYQRGLSHATPSEFDIQTIFKGSLKLEIAFKIKIIQQSILEVVRSFIDKAVIWNRSSPILLGYYENFFGFTFIWVNCSKHRYKIISSYFNTVSHSWIYQQKKKKRKENAPYVEVQYDPDEVSHKVPSVYWIFHLLILLFLCLVK